MSSLNSANFDTIVANGACGSDGLACPKGRLWVMDFYAPWCPHCRHFAPIWSRVAAKYSKLRTIKFGAVDCMHQEDLCRRFKVKGYPTIKAFVTKPGGTHVPLEGSIQFDGAHNQKDLADFVKVTLRDHFKVIDTTEWAAAHEAPPRTAAPSTAPTYAAIAGYTVTQRDLATGIFFWLAHGAFAPSESKLQGERLVNVLAWTRLLGHQLPGVRAELEELESRLAEQPVWSKPEFRLAWQDLKLWGLDSGTTYYQCGGYGCALWQLFHTLLQNTPENTSPLGTLQSIRRFVAYFFSCTSCQQHFDHMSRSLELEVDAKTGRRIDGALWLWRAHNEVTRRVAAHAHHPAVLYPTKEGCPLCKQGGDWDQSQVFRYLQLVYTDPVNHRQVAKLAPEEPKPTRPSPEEHMWPPGTTIGSRHQRHRQDDQEAPPQDGMQQDEDEQVRDEGSACAAGEIDCQKVCDAFGAPGRKCLAEAGDLGAPGLRLMCMCNGDGPGADLEKEASKHPPPEDLDKDKEEDDDDDSADEQAAPQEASVPAPAPRSRSASVHPEEPQRKAAEPPLTGKPGTHWEDPASKKRDAEAQKSAKARQASKAASAALSTSQQKQRNIILGVIIGVVSLAVVVGVVVHSRMSRDSTDGKGYSNCWNASVAPSYTKVKMDDDDDDYDAFGERTPRAHPAQA